MVIKNKIFEVRIYSKYILYDLNRFAIKRYETNFLNFVDFSILNSLFNQYLNIQHNIKKTVI